MEKIIKKYTVELVEVDGDEIIRRKNKGFNPLELLGLTSMLQEEITRMMRGQMEVDRVERVFVDDPDPTQKT